MRTARINYVGASDIEYTEIRPIRPNQSVVLAGLGVTGSRLQAATKDRRYRSTQGAGYSDGLVIHSRPATRPDTGGGDWHDPPPASRGGDAGLPRAGAEAGLAAVFPRYDLRQPRIVFEDEVFVPVTAGSGATPRLRSSSVSPVRSPQQPLPASTPGTNKRSVATTYDLCFEQHLQNLAHLDPDPGPSRLSFSTRSTTPVTARYREAACQTPTELNMRLSPMIAASAASLASEAQTNISVPKIIEDCLQEETEEKDDQKHELDEVTDDELDLIGDYMVRESLDVAASDLDSTIKDFTDLNGELSASDLREDQFTAKDYYRAGLSPPPELRADPAMGLGNYRENQKETPKFVPKFELNAIEENIRDPSEQICKELQSPRKVVRKK